MILDAGEEKDQLDIHDRNQADISLLGPVEEIRQVSEGGRARSAPTPQKQQTRTRCA